MSDPKVEDAMYDALIDDIMSLDEESLRRECAEDGESLDEAALRARGSLMGALDAQKAAVRKNLATLREQKIAKMKSLQFAFPDTPEERLALLRGKLAANTNAERMTAQFRNIESMSDDEVISALRQLHALESSTGSDE